MVICINNKKNDLIKKWLILICLSIIFFTGGYYWAFEQSMVNAREFIKYQCSMSHIMFEDKVYDFGGEFNVSPEAYKNITKFKTWNEEPTFRNLWKKITN